MNNESPAIYGPSCGHRSEWEKLLPIVTAFANGKTVQCLPGYPLGNPETAEWGDCANLVLKPTFQYRVAPKQDHLEDN